MGTVIPKLRASARGRECTLRSPVCNHDPDTTVLAHLPSVVKGMATKSDDWHAIFACSACHDAIDQHRLSGHANRSHMLDALQRTQKFWFDNGYLVIPGVLVKQPKPSKKILASKEMYR